MVRCLCFIEHGGSKRIASVDNQFRHKYTKSLHNINSTRYIHSFYFLRKILFDAIISKISITKMIYKEAI